MFGLTNRWSQPLAVAIRRFDFMKQCRGTVLARFWTLDMQKVLNYSVNVQNCSLTE
jgi:hypothetical protein